MNIGLIDVDRTRFPNIALGKIARNHRQNGDTVEWADAMFGQYDRVYASKVFNFTPDFTELYNCEVIRGGTGYDIHSKLPDDIDRLQPDYSIFPHLDRKTAYGFTTRGCPNRCAWCVVPAKEGSIKPYMDVEEIAIEGRRNLVLMDNNILASDYGIEQLEKVIKLGYRIDLNQANDARLITPDIARVFSQVRWINSIVRLGCDTTPQIVECERAMQMIDALSSSPKHYLMYTIIRGSLKECYFRLSYFKNNPRVRIVAQPYRDPNQVNEIPQWQKDMARWANRREFWTTCDFKDFAPRIGFRCEQYFNNPDLI